MRRFGRHIWENKVLIAQVSEECKKSGRKVWLFVMVTRKMHALVQVHLTTANQSEIRKAYLVSVMSLCSKQFIS